MGNLWSVTNALKYLGIKSEISSDTNKIASAEFLIIPGVGSFKLAMKKIKAKKINLAIYEAVKKKTRILGICLGLQLLGNYSDEDGGYEGLKIIQDNVVKIKNPKIKVPHVGFNVVTISNDKILFKGIKNKSDFYFNHSYCMKNIKKSFTTSICDQGEKFVSSLCKKNIFATQFHPEKSQSNGLVLLKNFFEN